MLELIIRNARLLDGRLVDVGMEDGYISALEPSIERSAKSELDAAGKLLMPAFVNGQLHACKVFWRRKLSSAPPENATARFALARMTKSSYTPEDVATRVSEALKLAIVHGSCAIRLFADVDETSGLNALKGLLKVKEHFTDLMQVQVVAFPQDGVGATTERLMREALELGADVVGGIPWIEPDEAAQRAHTDMCFTLAQDFDKDVHIVCDDTPSPESRTLEYLAHKTLQENYQNRVAATQCAALSYYDDSYAATVIQLVKTAAITIFSNTQVSLVTTPYERSPYSRGVTRIQELLAAGVPVACAQDDIDNWYYPFGRNDMLEVAQFMVHTGGFGWQAERVLPMVTDVPARVLALKNYGLEVGKTANLLLLNAETWHEALQFQAEKSAVILGGRLVAQTERHSQMLDNILS